MGESSRIMSDSSLLVASFPKNPFCLSAVPQGSVQGWHGFGMQHPRHTIVHENAAIVVFMLAVASLSRVYFGELN